MKKRISQLAVEIRHLLEKEGPSKLAALAREIKGATAYEIYMAVGWLAREGRVSFAELETGLTVMVSSASTQVVKTQTGLKKREGGGHRKSR